MEDDQKKVLTCTYCGKNTSKREGYTCPKCGKFVCSEHYDEDDMLCFSCIDESVEYASSEYKKLLEQVYADGQVDADERKMLEEARNRLNLAGFVANQLEKEFSANSADAGLTRIEEHKLSEASDDLKRFDLRKASEEIKDLYKNHPKNEAVLSLYLNIEKDINKNTAMAVIDNMKYDFKDAYLAAVDIALRTKDFRLAEQKLQKMKSTWSGDVDVELKEIDFEISFARETGNSKALGGAGARLDLIWNNLDLEQKGYAYYLRFLIQGDETYPGPLGELFRQSQAAGCPPYWFYRYGAVKISNAKNNSPKGLKEYFAEENGGEDNYNLSNTSSVRVNPASLNQSDFEKFNFHPARISADLGNRNAAKYVAECYSKGSSIPKDLEKANYYLSLSEGQVRELSGDALQKKSGHFLTSDFFDCFDEGAEILLDKGELEANARVTKSAKISGNGNTVLTPVKNDVGKDEFRTCLILESDTGGIISGMDFTGSDKEKDIGIMVLKGDWVIENCRFSGNFRRGIHVEGEEVNPVIRNCVFEGTQFGIVTKEKTCPVIEGNSFSRMELNGISANAGSNPRVRGNKFNSAKRTGIYVSGGSTGSYIENEFNGNNVAFWVTGQKTKPLVQANKIAGYIKKNEDEDEEWDDNKDPEDRGISIDNWAGGEYKGNSIEGYSGGIHCENSGGCLIVENFINHCHTNVYFHNAIGDIIKGNKLLGSRAVLNFYRDVKVEDNEIISEKEGSQNFGIVLSSHGEAKSSGTFSGNRISIKNGSGIWINENARGKFIQNSVENCQIGIEICDKPTDREGIMDFQGNRFSKNKKDWKKPFLSSKIKIK